VNLYQVVFKQDENVNQYAKEVELPNSVRKLKKLLESVIIPNIFEDPEDFNCYGTYLKSNELALIELNELPEILDPNSKWMKITIIIWMYLRIKRKEGNKEKQKQTLLTKKAKIEVENKIGSRLSRWEIEEGRRTLKEEEEHYEHINLGLLSKQIKELHSKQGKFRFKRNFVFTLTLMLRKSKIVKDIFLEKLIKKLINYFSMTSDNKVIKNSLHKKLSYTTKSIPKYINIKTNMEEEPKEDPIEIQKEEYLIKVKTAFINVRYNELKQLVEDKNRNQWLTEEEKKNYLEFIKFATDFNTTITGKDEKELDKTLKDQLTENLNWKEEWDKKHPKEEKEEDGEEEEEENINTKTYKKRKKK
jgi:hypothetical protein